MQILCKDPRESLFEASRHLETGGDLEETLQSLISRTGIGCQTVYPWVSPNPRLWQMHYFLADDTIELRALHSPNSGRDHIPVMVKRGKIPKSLLGGRENEYYHWRDFDIGVEVTSTWHSKHQHD